MVLIRQRGQRVVEEEITFAECDQCGKRNPADQDGYSDGYPDGWLRVGLVGSQATAAAFCSWRCVADYASGQAAAEAP